ncbi:MAG: hypothetical protein EAS51_01900 [Microbacteriaceae bacterium]|nr:MAG: hypothetical protein EAS51_01900 [Microbacteriaceae bacterium]
MSNAPTPRRRFATTTAVTAIVLSSVLVGTGTSYAYWSATTNATVSTTSGDVEVSVGAFTTTTLANHRREVTFPVTVTNNSVQNNPATLADLSITLSRDPAGVGFSGATTVSIWDQSAAACTAVSPPVLASGSWAGVTVSGLTIGKAAPKTYCVRTTLPRASDAGTSTGTNSFTARVSATASVGDFTDTDVRTAVQSTEYIYPVGSVSSSHLWIVRQGSATGECMDVSGGGTSNPGTDVIRWADCHQGTNQQWQFLPSSTPGYYLIRPQSSPAATVLVTGGGATVKVQSQTGAANQQWELQHKGGSIYQIVNRDTGYCLTAATAGSAMTTSACSGAATQAFHFTNYGNVPFANFDCSATTSGNPRPMTLTWASIGGIYTGDFRVQIKSGGWNTVATVPSTATSATVSIANGTYGGGIVGSTYNYRVVDASNNVWGSGTFSVNFAFLGSALTGCTP